MMYEAGQGVGQDIDLAEAWYKKASDGGQTGAMRRLGDLYATGKLAPRDLVKARDWYGRAAGQGDVEARAALKGLPRPAKGSTKP